MESEGAYLDRVEWVARRFAHVPNHVRCAAREYPVCSLSISRSIRILSIAFGGRAAMLVRVELPWILGPYLYLRRTNEGSERSCRSALCNPLPGERRPPRGEITQTWCLACGRSTGGPFTDDREARAVHDEVETATRANSTTRSEIQRLPAADERILTHQLDRVCSPAPNVIRLPLPSRRNSMPSCCASRHPRADGEARLSCKCAASWQRLQLAQHCHDGRVLT